MGALDLLILAAKAVPVMIDAGHTVASVMAMWDGAGSTVKKAQAEGRDPTQAEWDAINAAIDADVAVIDAG